MLKYTAVCISNRELKDSLLRTVLPPTLTYQRISNRELKAFLTSSGLIFLPDGLCISNRELKEEIDFDGGDGAVIAASQIEN